MEGFGVSTYGDAFADVYDQWYGELTDIASFTALVYGLALDGLPVLELGIGTGRLAIPLADAGLDVVGVDASEAMLARLARPTAPGAGTITVTCGDMVDDMPNGPFGLASLGFNTLFNLLTERRQQTCFDALAMRLAPGAHVIVENAWIDDGEADDRVSVRSMTATEVVLAVTRSSPDEQRIEGHYVSLTETGGVRLRPWAIRWLTPTQQDDLAAASGFELIGRYAGHDRSPISDNATRHVTVYRLAPT